MEVSAIRFNFFDTMIIVLLMISTIIILLIILIRIFFYIIESRHEAVIALLRNEYDYMRDSRDNNEQAALQATIILENHINSDRERVGLKPFPIVLSELPEYSVADKQASMTRFATIKARITAAAMMIDEEIPEIQSFKEE